MKRFTVLFFVLVSELSWAQKGPFARVQSFFEAFHQRDSIQLTHHFDPEAKLLFTSNNPQGRPKQKKRWADGQRKGMGSGIRQAGSE